VSFVTVNRRPLPLTTLAHLPSPDSPEVLRAPAARLFSQNLVVPARLGLRRLGRADEARAFCRRALELANAEPERRFLERRLAEL
jgi:predicted RNA polymerase sigma factor